MAEADNKETNETNIDDGSERVTISDIELTELKNEVEDFRNKYFRQLAETENVRKRLMKEKDELVHFAIRNLICDFLHPIDNMENALGFTESASDDVKHWAHGFKMILTQFKDVLADNGVHSYVSEGKKFDPHLHDAIDTVASKDLEPGTVVEEILHGYSMGEKIIRHARVIVSKAPTDEHINQEALTTENQENNNQ